MHLTRSTNLLLIVPHLIKRSLFFFFFNDTATTEIYTLSLHDALPICHLWQARQRAGALPRPLPAQLPADDRREDRKSTRLNSVTVNLVCRLLLEKNKEHKISPAHTADSRTHQPPQVAVRRV